MIIYVVIRCEKIGVADFTLTFLSFSTFAESGSWRKRKKRTV